MFTGIIEEIGIVSRIIRQGESLRLTIEASRVLTDVHIGDSIAVSGVCLTVTSYDHRFMTVDVVPETYRRSALKSIGPGDRVNLERAMAANGRFGGHIVQGHVDSVGTVVSRSAEHNAVVFVIRPEEVGTMRYIVAKGSITIDGISLTVAAVGDVTFSVSLIPHTLAETTMALRQPGDIVNLETDIIGKYVERLLLGRVGGQLDPGTARSGGSVKSSVTEQLLQEHGFI